MKNLIFLTQLGLSLIIPLLLCLGICWWAAARFHIGGWIYIPGFFFGIGGSAMVAYKFYLGVVKEQGKEKKRKKTGFNRHR